MGAQKGRDFLLKLRTDSGQPFVTVAGLRSRQLVFNAETVDITHTESAGRWRELLAGAGVQRASIAGSGVFKDADSDATMRTAFFGGQILEWQIIMPDFGTIEGPFQIATLEYSGEHNAEVTFELALESAGSLAFAVVA
jgi:TP901-1 family phage major tail protein